MKRCRFDKLVRKSYNSGSYVAYAYNAEGSLARLSYGDSTGELASYRFEYDSLGRLIRSAELDADGSTVQRTEHIYDGYNRLSRQSWTLGGKTYSESYVYDDPSDNNKNGDGASDNNQSGGVAIITFWNGTFQDDSGNPIAINPFKGAHTVAVTATASGGIRVYNAYNDGKRPREFDCWEDYIKTGVFMSDYYIAN